MVFKTLIYEVKEEKVAFITLNRPEKFNPLNNELAREMKEAMDMAEKDEDVRVLVLTGAGKAFSAGGELSVLEAADTVGKKREILDSVAMIIKAVENFRKPLIAALNGVAAGSGTALAQACDIIVASDKARFAPNFVNVALVPDGGTSWYLARRVGYQKAVELMLTGTVLDAREALALGIYNRVVEQERFNDEVLALARSLARGPARAMARIKMLLKASMSSSLDAQIELEASSQLLALSEDDFAEGVRAFYEKRSPRFK